MPYSLKIVFRTETVLDAEVDAIALMTEISRSSLQLEDVEYHSIQRNQCQASPKALMECHGVALVPSVLTGDLFDMLGTHVLLL
jgi:hypothetical protein